MNSHNIDTRRNPFVIETTKVAEITDQFGHTRYKVVLTDFDQNVCENEENDNLLIQDQAFQIEVWCYVLGENPILVFRSEIIENYQHALHIFYDKTNTYKALIKAETRETQNIWLHSDKIHYHIIDPKCCKKCKFARPIPNHAELYSRDKIGKFECTNPLLHIQQDNLSYDDLSYEGNEHRPYDTRHHYIPICPEVDGNGICDLYKDKECK